MRAFVAGLLVVGMVGVEGCGGSDATGPSPSASITGTWHMSLSNLTANGVTCSASDITLELQANGSGFSGTYHGIMACGPTGGQASGSSIAGTIAHGSRNGSQVSFDFDTSELHHTGTINGDSMSGSANYQLNFTSGLTIVSGSWTATR